MLNPTTLTALVLILALLVSGVLAHARGIGPLVTLGLILGVTVGITATLLATNST